MGGRSFLDEGTDADGAAGAARPRRRAAAIRTVRTALGLCCLLLLALVTGAAAPASAENVLHGHLGTIKATKTCPLGEPTGVAVNETTGDIYVVDALSKRLERFNSAGQCLEQVGVGEASAVAVDNSKEASDPSKGDVYVATVNEALTEGIFFVDKYPAGELQKHLIAKIKRFKTEPEGSFEVFEEPILGLGVDSSGKLWIDDGEKIYGFNNEEPLNHFATLVENSGNCGAARGFGVTPDATHFFVARERENRKEECEGEDVVMVELNEAGEPVHEQAYKSQLDASNTAGMAIDPIDSTLYFDNVTSVAAYTSEGHFIQRFGEELHLGSAVAVDHATNDVYVPDAAEEAIQVYGKVSGPPNEPPKPEGALADGRRWEMVTPPNKHGGAIYGITTKFGVLQASADGNSIAYTSNEPLVKEVPTNRAPEVSMNLSRRGSSAWGTESIETPHPEFPNGSNNAGNEWEFFAEDLSAGFVDPFRHGVPTPPERLAPEATEGTPYRRTLTTPTSGCEPVPSSCYQALVSPLDTSGAPPFYGKTEFATATPDGTHAILKSEVPLNGEATQAEGLYEWTFTGAAGGSLRFVSALPAEESKEQVIEPTVGAGVGGGNAPASISRHAVSSDGSRVVWGYAPSNTTAETSTEPGASALYVRDLTKGETIRIDRPEKGIPLSNVTGARFQTASADGRRIFFTDTQPLTSNATTTADEGEAEAAEKEEEVNLGDLYVCEVVEEAGGKLGCKLTDLTASVAVPNVELAAVQGIPGAGDEGKTIYFVADGALSRHAGQGNCTRRTALDQEKERAGELPVQACNLYATQLGSEGWGSPKLIATLTSNDLHDWQVLTSEVEFGGLGGLTSRVSPNGEYLSFMSNSPLTGYNNEDALHAGVHDEEVFLYNAKSTDLACPSCNPSGHQPTGVHDVRESGEGLGLIIDRPAIWNDMWLAANIPGWSSPTGEGAVHQPRYLSDSGRLFFNSADPLVPADKNGTKSDVYEFEPNGVGTCTSPTGCVSLMSSGESPQEAGLLDASEHGESVFFMTSQRLVPEQDVDTGFDIYDARECGASPCLSPPPPPPPPCETEEACKGSATTVPALGGAPASTQPGSGNAGTLRVLGTGTSKPKPKPKPLTRKQLLAKALKKCKKLKKKSKRVACERQARRKYGTSKKGKKGKGARRATTRRSGR